MTNLTEVFPCFFLSCKTNARVKLTERRDYINFKLVWQIWKMEKPLPVPENWKKKLSRPAHAHYLYRLHHPVCRYMHNCGNQHKYNEMLSYISEAVRREPKKKPLSRNSGRLESSLGLASLSLSPDFSRSFKCKYVPCMKKRPENRLISLLRNTVYCGVACVPDQKHRTACIVSLSKQCRKFWLLQFFLMQITPKKHLSFQIQFCDGFEFVFRDV